MTDPDRPHDPSGAPPAAPPGVSVVVSRSSPLSAPSPLVAETAPLAPPISSPFASGSGPASLNEPGPPSPRSGAPRSGAHQAAPLPQGGAVVRSARGASYLLGQRLGGGEFGAVYECIGPFDQAFALKVFLPGRRAQEEVRAEWLREADRLYRLRHPNIVYVHDYFEAEGLFYLVLERCDHSLERMLGTPFTHRLVVDVARQLLFAVQYLAGSGIVHNDLHAGNVLVVQGDRLVVKLSDLGIAQELYGYHAVRPAIVQHRIMAPEVAAGGYSTRQSDLYQLGLVMYQMLTGEAAVDTSLGYDAVVRQIQEGVPRAKAEALASPLGNVVAGMLRRHEQYRYSSALEVWEDLRRLDVWSHDRAQRLSTRSGET